MQKQAGGAFETATVKFPEAVTVSMLWRELFHEMLLQMLCMVLSHIPGLLLSEGAKSYLYEGG